MIYTLGYAPKYDTYEPGTKKTGRTPEPCDMFPEGYAGGSCWRTPREVYEWIDKNQPRLDGYACYELEGDFDEDTDVPRRYKRESSQLTQDDVLSTVLWMIGDSLPWRDLLHDRVILRKIPRHLAWTRMDIELARQHMEKMEPCDDAQVIYLSPGAVDLHADGDVAGFGETIFNVIVSANTAGYELCECGATVDTEIFSSCHECGATVEA